MLYWSEINYAIFSDIKLTQRVALVLEGMGYSHSFMATTAI